MIVSYEHVICQKCCKLRWPGLWTHACTNIAFLRTSLRCFWHCFIWKYFFEFDYCSVIFHLFLHKKLRNDWRWFCASGVLSRVVCPLLGWFIYWILWFLSLHVQFRCRLIFWSTFVLCLIVFEGQIPHFCKFCRAMVCLGVTCSFFSISSFNILFFFVFRFFI